MTTYFRALRPRPIAACLTSVAIALTGLAMAAMPASASLTFTRHGSFDVSAEPAMWPPLTSTTATATFARR